MLITRINNNNISHAILASGKTSEFNFSGRMIDLPESPVALPAYRSFQALFSASFMKPNFKIQATPIPNFSDLSENTFS